MAHIANFHSEPKHKVESLLQADFENGLSQESAAYRLKKYGQNTFTDSQTRSVLLILTQQLGNFFFWLLLVAAIISYLVDGLGHALILVVIIIINTSLGFFQEYKAERAIAELKKNFSAKTKVLRDGRLKAINTEDITIGDIVYLESGDRVPADLRVIKEESCRADESALTGESVPVSKNEKTSPLISNIADRRNILYSGTLVVSGHAEGVVFAVGNSTEFGKIAKMIEKADEKTPLEKRITYLGKVLTFVSIAIVALIFVLGYLRGMEVLPLLNFTIALLVAAVPESLPTVITLLLAIGVARMAKKKAIVRRMAVIETLGTTNVIATDKTGTLTDNKLILDIIDRLEGSRIIQTKVSMLAEDDLGIVTKSALCSNVELHGDKNFIGDPVEVAIAEVLTPKERQEIFRYKRILEIPFDSDKKYMAVLVEAEEKEFIVKGSPGVVTGFCAMSDEEHSKVEAEVLELSKKGYKVLAVASKIIKKGVSEKPEKLKFDGLLAMIDKPSAGVADAIAQTISAGIRPIIMTGDHPETARYVAKNIGLDVDDNEILTQQDFEKLSKKDLEKAVARVKIFARISPADKIKIVQTLNDLGYSVAVTGDGVNDAPALKEASVGIAMGIKGTDVAKESSDIILSDDKYSTIVSAIRYGRGIYDNLKTVVTFYLSGNFDELFIIAFAFIFGLPAPLLTLQILWINMISDSFPALAMAFEKPSRTLLKDSPRSAKNDSLKENIIYAIYLGLIGFTISLLLYLYGLNSSIDKARTFVFMFAIFVQFAYVLSIRSKDRIWQRPASFVENKFLIGGIVISSLLQIVLFTAPFSNVFNVVALNIREGLALGGAVFAAFVLAELIRYYRDRRAKALNF